MIMDGLCIIIGYDIIYYIVVVYLYIVFFYWFKIKGWLLLLNCLYLWDGYVFFF